jgi:hypothetical protein
MTESEVRALIRSAVASAPSLRQLAKQWGVSPAYLSDCCSRRRAPGPKLLKRLGIKRRVAVSYERVGGE